MIYRGYTIERDRLGQWIVRLGEAIVHTASSEEAALTWIDTEKRKQRQ